MAFIIVQDFEDYSPVYNDVNVVVKDPAISTGADFRYIFDVYITGVTDPIRFKVNKDPVLSYGTLNLSRIMSTFTKNYIFEGIDFNNVCTANQLSLREFKIHYGYEYRPAPGDPILVVPDVLIGSNKYVYNSALPYNEWIDFDFNDYDLNNGTTGKFLTDNLTENYINYDEQAYVNVIMSSAYVFEYVEIKTYDVDGVLIDTYRAQNITAPTSFYSRFQTIFSGTYSLNNITSGLVLGSQPIIDTTVKSYTIQCLDSTFVPVSNIITYNIDDCERFETKRLVYLNKFGGFDSFSFKLVNTESIAIERKSYKINPNRLGASGLDYSKKDKTNQNYHTKYMDKIKLVSDWISENESNYLKQLLVSNEIYLDNGDGTLTAVKGVTQKDYTIKKTKTDKLFNLTIDIEMSNDNYSQSF